LDTLVVKVALFDTTAFVAALDDIKTITKLATADIALYNSYGGVINGLKTDLPTLIADTQQWTRGVCRWVQSLVFASVNHYLPSYLRVPYLTR
jgi:hypothetical protein